MRYCNHCRRLTTGEPLFCNFCGRSYNFRLCPHRHPNPRNAGICSQCGSRDLSTPHPRVPFLLAPLTVLLSALPGLLLLLLSVMFLLGLLRVLTTDQQLLSQFMVIGLFIAFLWWLYLKLPRFLRRGLSRLLRKPERNEHDY